MLLSKRQARWGIAGGLMFCMCAWSGWAGEAVVTGTAFGPMLAAGNNRVLILSPSGQVLWQYPAGLVHDVWMLPNGNVLFADGISVTEVTPDKTVVFQYKSASQAGGGTFSCQRLPNGDTLIGENSTGKVLEVDPTISVVFSLQTDGFKPGSHQNLRMVRKLDNGNYLVCHSGASVVKEYTPAAEVVWESQQPGKLAFAAIRTPKQTTLVSSLDQVVEYDESGKVVWECATEDLAEIAVRNITGMHLLPSGDIVLGCYSAYKAGGGCSLLQITREKTVVWSYAKPDGDSSMMGVQLLSADGTPLAASCRR